jgi:thiosulfate/3-mercaptopyruvate sulfurtransferase
MRCAGVSADRPVVIYDDAGSVPAARGWWLLRYFGHALVAVLDGGLAGWVGAGHPVRTETPPVEPGDFTASPGGMPVMTAEQAGATATEGVLIDARAEERFRGIVEPIDPVAGHIPGARNRPSTDNVDADGRFVGRQTLRAAYDRLGVSDDLPVAAYCGSGVTAAQEVLALEVAGYRAALYVGSWSEWITDPGRPIAREAAAD